MKSLILGLLLFAFSACTSAPTDNQRDFSFQSAERLQISKSTISDMQMKFGKPSEVKHTADTETWTYRDPNNDYQRLTATFNKASVLQSLIWIPQSNEKETELQNIKNYFPEANFKAIPSPDTNPHAISSMISYIDEKLGMTILYQVGRNAVEAIVWTDKTRSPATFKESDIGPYTIGE